MLLPSACASDVVALLPRFVWVWAVLLILAGGAGAADDDDGDSEDPLAEKRRIEAEVDEALEKGIDWLLAEIEQAQTHGEGDRIIGHVALETYALLVAGVWEQHPLIQANFQYLDERVLRSRHIYSIACYIFALDAAISQLEQDYLITTPRSTQSRILDNPAIGKKYRSKLKNAVKSLLGGQNRTDLWRYHTTSQDMDNSVTQFAMLALGVGDKRGAKIPDKAWKRASRKLVSLQHPGDQKTERRLTPYDHPDEHRDRVDLADKSGEGSSDKDSNDKKDARDKEKGRGRTRVNEEEEEGAEIDPLFAEESADFFVRGFGYTVNNKGEPGDQTWNMTCSGVSSLLLARRALKGKLQPRELTELNQSLRDGYGWLMENWSPRTDYYGMYSLEKVADIGGVKLFGGNDWFDEVRSELLKRQEDDGGWRKGGGHGENRRVSTAFALLILNRATTLLTSNPAKRLIVYSGGRTREEEIRNREWVFIPDLDATVHYPDVLRQARRRPSVLLVRLLAKIVDNYPPEFLPELLPPMVEVRKSVEHPAVRRVLDSYLQQMVGIDLGQLDKYSQWYASWNEIEGIGKARDKTQKQKVLDYYEKAGESLQARHVAMRAIWDCKLREALPLFLNDMENSDVAIRDAAYREFRRFFLDLPPSFDSTAAKAERQDQIAAIRKWYAEHENSAVR